MDERLPHHRWQAGRDAGLRVGAAQQEVALHEPGAGVLPQRVQVRLSQRHSQVGIARDAAVEQDLHSCLPLPHNVNAQCLVLQT